MTHHWEWSQKLELTGHERWPEAKQQASVATAQPGLITAQAPSAGATFRHCPQKNTVDSTAMRETRVENAARSYARDLLSFCG